MPPSFGQEIGVGPEHVSDRDEEHHQEGRRVRLGVRFDDVDDVACQSVISGSRQRCRPRGRCEGRLVFQFFADILAAEILRSQAAPSKTVKVRRFGFSNPRPQLMVDARHDSSAMLVQAVDGRVRHRGGPHNPAPRPGTYGGTEPGHLAKPRCCDSQVTKPSRPSAIWHRPDARSKAPTARCASARTAPAAQAAPQPG